MPNFLCTTCGTQYAESDQPPATCAICQDERQYVKATGQQWTTLDKLRLTNRNSLKFKEPGRHAFFQVGEASVLLAFRAEATLKGDPLPPHGATGPGHFALGIAAEDLDGWRKLLQGHGVTIEKEVGWPRGGKSLYFRDPAGNSVELVTPGVWGLPSGW